MLHSYNHEPFYLYSHGVREELPLPLSGIRRGGWTLLVVCLLILVIGTHQFLCRCKEGIVILVSIVERIILFLVLDEVTVFILHQEGTAKLLVGCALTENSVDRLSVNTAGAGILFLAQVGELDLVAVLIQNANIECERLQLLDHDLEGLGNAGSRNVLTLDDRLISAATSVDIVGLDGQDLLQGVCGTVSLERQTSISPKR